MNSTKLDLARQLVARPWWRWRPGMAWVRRDTTDTFTLQRGRHLRPPGPEAPWGALPDLADDAMGSVLLRLLERSYRLECDLQGIDNVYFLGVGKGPRSVSVHGTTLAEAAACALLAVRGAS